MKMEISETASSVIYNYQATLKDYDAGEPVGYGKTRLEAITDLLQQLDEQHENN
jgi:hypothetical protein